MPNTLTRCGHFRSAGCLDGGAIRHGRTDVLRRRHRADDLGIIEQNDMRMRLVLSSRDEGDRAVRGARLSQAQNTNWPGFGAGARIFPVRKGELKAGLRTCLVGHSRDPELARGHKPKLGAVMSSDLLVVVSRGQGEILRRWRDDFAVDRKARPLASTVLGGARVTPMFQRRGWSALSSLDRECSGEIQDGLGGGRSDADLVSVLQQHARTDSGAK